jgi:hypothetical protein
LVQCRLLPIQSGHASAEERNSTNLLSKVVELAKCTTEPKQTTIIDIIASYHEFVQNMMAKCFRMDHVITIAKKSKNCTKIQELRGPFNSYMKLHRCL